jgi:replicative DNA helicase
VSDSFETASARSRPTLDRLPPHSSEAEQGVLGCIFLDPAQALPLCIEKFRSGSDVFYDLRHQEIYNTFIELFEDGDPIDIISVVERLKLWDKLEQVGGVSYLAALPDTVPSAANLLHYLDILRGKHTLRRMIHACTEAVGRIYDHEGDVDELMDQVERNILQISESRVEPVSMSMPSLVDQSMQDFEQAIQNHGAPSGLKTGFVDLDRLTDGLHGGEMIILAGRPATGKTSLAMNIAEHVACDQGLPVGVIEMEMTGKELVKRMICSRARVNMRNFRDGQLASGDYPKMTAASITLHSAPIYIDDTPGQSILAIRARARRWWQQYGIKLLLIDYLGLGNASGTSRRFENRQQEVSQISVGIKGIAKELGIPVIALSQLNRDIERDKNRKPRLSDLRESGSLEQDADIVGFLYRPKADDEDTYDDSEAEEVNLLIAKQRNGKSMVDVHFTFLKSFTRFESAAKISDSDVPQHSSHSHSQPPEPEPEYQPEFEQTTP